MGGNGAMIAVSAICVVACVAAVTVGVTKFGNKSESSGGESGGGGGISTSTKAVQSVCEPTRYKDACADSLNKNAGGSNDPKELVKAAFTAAKTEITTALEQSDAIKAAQNDPRAAEGLEICKEVVGFSINDLEKTIDAVPAFDMQNMDNFIEDLRIWIGGAISYQEVCFDAFENSTSDAGTKMRNMFNVSRELTSNALNIITGIKTILTQLNVPGLDLSAFGSGGGAPAGGAPGAAAGSGSTGTVAAGQRRLMGKPWVAGEMPPWVNDPKRKIMNTPLNKIKADAVVPDQHETIAEALKAVPDDNDSPFIIHIKAGVYKEQVLVAKKQTNVVLVGDGKTKTVITGSKNFADGVQTFKTSTVAALGDGFMARDIGFENTAGAKGHQAVALRVVGDFAVLYNCKMDGYQDTLYAVRGRQFYRDCIITGTVDFIFGDAQAVFQKCEIRIRKPDADQKCMVTAQGRTEPQGPGGFVLQGCTITGEPDYMAAKDEFPAYLGRPWKEYSRTIVMTSNIDDSIAPEGWKEWKGNFALDTLYYAEFENKGAGSKMDQRVKWKGIKTLSPKDAESFTPGKLFVTGDKWIPESGVPYAPGALNA